MLLHIVIPLIVGAILYYVLSPEVIVVRQLDSLLGIENRWPVISTDFFVIRFIRNYVLDMLWGYALVFALAYVSGNNVAYLTRIFLIAFVFSGVMEFLQLTPVAKGTFDWYDILVEFLAELGAIFIIKKYNQGEN